MVGLMQRAAVSLAVLGLLALAWLSSNPKIVVEKWRGELPEGTYFMLSKIPENFNPTMEMEWLRRNGFDVKDAWYVPYSPECCPEGSDVCLMVVVKPVFLVRTSGEMPEGYERVESPSLGPCPSLAVHLKWEK